MGHHKIAQQLIEDPRRGELAVAVRPYGAQRLLQADGVWRNLRHERVRSRIFPPQSAARGILDETRHLAYRPVSDITRSVGRRRLQPIPPRSDLACGLLRDSHDRRLL